jgi:hypothetical protein
MLLSLVYYYFYSLFFHRNTEICYQKRILVPKFQVFFAVKPVHWPNNAPFLSPEVELFTNLSNYVLVVMLGLKPIGHQMCCQLSYVKFVTRDLFK